ncbi:diadenosine tetraphosphatase [Catenovulum agarivorans DS-2]|uniref:bis(5'-nucleosyl)-tetraphosphatase (symmetrical) n=1 Tax=Catenovulum agarivorans DS-2 TaxID=1328313 RepID=W7QMH0_9ALTE|nr:symmetrical bis(5'-nucleosyl)-tetraphosphatase [Catenovulum agarivorans]EWH09113.1 diadenosine tetraphosphatase [Catenovulum agarivorans DS-2]
MAHYFVGDIQGCYDELMRLLERVNFDPSQDKLCPVGDLVARGPASEKVAKLMLDMQSSVMAVLGNHDLHFLSTLHGLYQAKKNDHLDALLNAPFAQAYGQWLLQQPLVRHFSDLDIVMSHAGLHPQLTLQQHLEMSQWVQQVLQNGQPKPWLKGMYGDKVNKLHADSSVQDKFNFIINVTTRMRYLKSKGQLDFKCKDTLAAAPEHLTPWFKMPRVEQSDYQIVFGHWASLMGSVQNQHYMALDTGCVWGQYMTMYCAETGTKYQQSSL